MEQNAAMEDLKKEVFNRFMDMSGRVYVNVRFSDAVKLGLRGFTPEEQQKGVILVFNNTMNFSWGDGMIKARLLFGSKAEDCEIPTEDVMAIFSPELNAQFVAVPQGMAAEAGAAGSAGDKSEKIVEVDFKKKDKDK